METVKNTIKILSIIIIVPSVIISGTVYAKDIQNRLDKQYNIYERLTSK
jgi:hypothetical protein